MSKSSIGIALIGILAVIGFGLSGFMFLFPASDKGLILVGFWEDLDKNTSYSPYNEDYDWLLEYDNNQILNPSYISMSNGDTRFTLLQPGYYKISLSLFFGSMETIILGHVYYVMLQKNGVDDGVLVRIYEPSGNTGAQFPSIKSELYVYSDGSNYFQINCFDNGGSGADSFTVESNQIFNQFSIEYVL